VVRIADHASSLDILAETVTWRSGGLLLAGMAVLILRWRVAARGARRHHRMAGTSGMAVAMDLVLVTPIFMFVMLLILQWAILMKDLLLVHHAAYVAARSAKVHLCPGPIGSAGLMKMRALGSLPCTDDHRKAEDAARYVLVTASPFAGSLQCEGGCSPPSAAFEALARGTDTHRNMQAWLAQARYAFDPANVSVRVELTPFAQAGAGEANPGEQAVRARVSFRHILLPWMEIAFGDGRRTDGTAYSTLVAEVSLT
jgi:hypothetical protein